VIVVNSITDGAIPAPDQQYTSVQRLHELQRQDHPRHPVDELLSNATGWPPAWPASSIRRR